MARPRAASSDPSADEAAEKAIASGGNAVDAIIAGFLAAAAARPGVLLGPVVALVAGVGVGARAFDGRCCQPGLEAPRPRGLMADEAVPSAARAAVPRSLAALSLLHAYGSARPMSALIRPARAAAKEREAPERLALIEAVVHTGPQALLVSDRLRAILRAAGSVAGGLVGEADLRGARPADAALAFTAADAGLELASPPFATPATPASDTIPDAAPALRRAEVLVAGDGHGKVAALAFCPDDEGVEVPELGICLARDAEPVRRGVTRVTPGTPRPIAAPIAIARRPADGWFAALGVAGAAALALEALMGTPVPPATSLSSQIEALRAASRGSSGLAASVRRGQTALERTDR